MDLSPAKEVRRQFGKVARALDRLASDPHPKNIHPFRTSSRRMETTLEILVPCADRNQHKLLKQLSKLRRRAGRVRDLDIQIAALRSLKAFDQPRIKTQVLETLFELRSRQEKKLIQCLDRDEIGRVRRRLSRAQERFPNPAPDPLIAVTQMLSRLATGSHPLNEKLLDHYRTEGKKIRYIAELATGNRYAEHIVHEFKLMQDALGEWHDWLILSDTLEKLLPHAPNSPLLTAAMNLRRTKYRDAIQAVSNARKTSHPTRLMETSGTPHRQSPSLQLLTAA